MKKAVKKLWNVLSAVFTALAVILAVILVCPRVLGYRPFSVLSPSMTPKYRPGDIVYVKQAAFEEIGEGDVITFVLDEELHIATHRVVGIDRKDRSFTTKGDANDSQDTNPVLYENVVGVVRFSLPKIGYISNLLSTPTGRYVAATLIFILLLIYILPEIYKKQAGKKRTGDDEKNAEEAQRKDGSTQ